MSAAHTPGPWVYYYDAHEHYKHRIHAKPGLICMMPEWRMREELRLEQEANAHLICAAPELLEALQKFVDYEKAMDEFDDVRGILIYAEFSRLASVAIAKAKGGAA